MQDFYLVLAQLALDEEYLVEVMTENEFPLVLATRKGWFVWHFSPFAYNNSIICGDCQVGPRPISNVVNYMV